MIDLRKAPVAATVLKDWAAERVNEWMSWPLRCTRTGHWMDEWSVKGCWDECNVRWIKDDVDASLLCAEFLKDNGIKRRSRLMLWTTELTPSDCVHGLSGLSVCICLSV